MNHYQVRNCKTSGFAEDASIEPVEPTKHEGQECFLYPDPARFMRQLATRKKVNGTIFLPGNDPGLTIHGLK